MKFARFGGLSSVKQKGYDVSMPWFHSPPARRGIYCFIWPYYEPFLLGGTSYSGIHTKYAKHEFVKDKEGNIVEVEPYDDSIDIMTYKSPNFMKVYSSVEIDGKYYKTKPKKVKVFDYQGEVWHHLGHNLKPSEILQTKGGWVLTDMYYFKKAFKKEFSQLIKGYKSAHKSWCNGQLPNAMNNITKHVCIDHLEVFIEKV